MLPELKVNRERMESAAADPQLLATGLAEYLVGKGMPFREAHAIVGSLAASGKALTALPDEEFRAASNVFGEDVREIFDVRKGTRAAAPPLVRLHWRTSSARSPAGANCFCSNGLKPPSTGE